MGAVTRWFCLTKASASAGTRRIVLLFSTLVAGMLALAAPVSATTETFNVTGGPQTWTVPAGVTEATFDLYGAQGWGTDVYVSYPRTRRGERRRRLRSPPAPRSRSTSAVRGFLPRCAGFNGGGAGASAPWRRECRRRRRRRRLGHSRRRHGAHRSRARRGRRRGSRGAPPVSMGPTPPEAAGAESPVSPGSARVIAPLRQRRRRGNAERRGEPPRRRRRRAASASAASAAFDESQDACAVVAAAAAGMAVAAGRRRRRRRRLGLRTPRHRLCRPGSTAATGSSRSPTRPRSTR